MTSSPHPQAITPGVETAPATAPGRTRVRSPRILTAVAAAAATATALALTGCTAPGTGPSTGTNVSTASPAAAQKAPIELPDTPLGEQAAWVLAALNAADHDGTPAATAAAIEERLAPATLTEITPAQLRDVFTQIGATAPWAPTAIQDAGSQAVVTITDSAGDSLDLQLTLDAGDRIAGILFSPSAADRTPATSWTELEDAVATLAADTRLTVTELGTGTDATRLLDTGTVDGRPAAASDPALPSGSMFKLYVLGAVADAVAQGRLAWTTPLTLTDDLKSLPSGELQNEPAGTQVTVQDAAAAMIEISDNTATDLLIAAVGAPAVEQAFADLGHHDPALNTPLLTTRALFELGWGGPDGDGGAAREAWVAAGDGTDDATAERRSILSSLPTGLPQIAVENVTTPVWQDGLDWFTTADDLVAVHEALQQRAATPAGEPLRAILSKNPGLGDTFGEAWSYAAFKGGSSVGVLAGSWYLERADGRRFVVSIQGRSDDPAALADQATFFGQVQDAVALLEQE